MANLNTHATSHTGLVPTNAKFFDRHLLENAQPELVHYQLGVKSTLPKNNGKTYQFRRWAPMEPTTTPLTEGVVPNGQTISVSTVEATVAGYGQYVACTDMLELASLDQFVQNAAKELGVQGGQTIDMVVRDVIAGCSKVQYAGSATARNQITAANKLTVNELRKAVRTLKQNNAPKFNKNGKRFYVAIVAPEASYDLQSDELWIDASKYAADEQLLTGELGTIFGCKLVESTSAKKFAGAGASSADVFATLVMGDKAFGCIDIMSDSDPNHIKTIVKHRGSAGSSDPLDQITTVGWKVDAFAAAILNEGWILRIEHGASA